MPNFIEFFLVSLRIFLFISTGILVYLCIYLFILHTHVEENTLKLNSHICELCLQQAFRLSTEVILKSLYIFEYYSPTDQKE